MPMNRVECNALRELIEAAEEAAHALEVLINCGDGITSPAECSTRLRALRNKTAIAKSLLETQGVSAR